MFLPSESSPSLTRLAAHRVRNSSCFTTALRPRRFPQFPRGFKRMVSKKLTQDRLPASAPVICHHISNLQPPNPLLNVLSCCRGPSGPCVLEGASSSLPAPWSFQALLWHLLCAIFPDSPHPKPSYTPLHNPLIRSPCHTRYHHYFSLICLSYHTVN